MSTTWDNGRIIGEASGHYHACPAISASKLKVFSKSPQLFYRRYISKIIPQPEPTADMLLGQAAHSLILEGPAAFSASVAIRPEGIDRRTTAGKAAWAEFCVRSEGKVIIDGEQAEQVNRMSQSVAAHPAASALLTGTTPEITWRASLGGMRVQCRPDAWGENLVNVPGRAEPVGLRVGDLKTCESLDELDYSSFQRQFWNLGYYKQAGFYLALLHSMLTPEQIPADGIPFFFIAVEKNEPFQTLVVEPDQEALAEGYESAMADLVRLRDCVAANYWPGTPETVLPMGIPSWFVKKSQAKRVSARSALDAVLKGGASW